MLPDIKGRQRQHGPIPLTLEHEDRRWLRDEARANDVLSSEAAAYLVRAARLSGLGLREAGEMLANGGASEGAAEYEDDGYAEESPVNPAPTAAEIAGWDPDPDKRDWEPAPAPRRAAPVASPKPFAGRHGARSDIVQLHELGSVTAPAGMRDEYMRDGDIQGDPQGNLIRRNYSHLRKGA